jgi:hypothetical protein
MFGRLAWVEAQQDAMLVNYARHLDEHRDDREASDKFRETLIGKIDTNARACNDATDRVESKVDKLVWKILAVVLAIAGAFGGYIMLRPHP